jgi:hypothetical protein
MELENPERAKISKFSSSAMKEIASEFCRIEAK